MAPSLLVFAFRTFVKRKTRGAGGIRAHQFRGFHEGSTSVDYIASCSVEGAKRDGPGGIRTLDQLDYSLTVETTLRIPRTVAAGHYKYR